MGDDESTILREGGDDDHPESSSQIPMREEHFVNALDMSKIDTKSMDEFGLPLWWRKPYVEQELVRSTAKAFALFEHWCEESGRRAFPASPETVEAFLRSGAIRGPQLYEVWEAITLRHDAYYWHTDADPVMVLVFAKHISVSEDGEIVGLNSTA